MSEEKVDSLTELAALQQQVLDALAAVTRKTAAIFSVFYEQDRELKEMMKTALENPDERKALVQQICDRALENQVARRPYCDLRQQFRNIVGKELGFILTPEDEARVKAADRIIDAINKKQH